MKHLAAALSIIVIFGSATAAGAADWAVVQMSGKVSIHVSGAQPVALAAGTTLPPGGVLATGEASRALLVRGQEQIVVGPNAVIAIPPGKADSQFTTILQSAGVVEFSVEKRNVRHFAVQTPVLAAVVKGTHFAVGAFNTTGAVRVASGRVEVTALASGHVTTVGPGQLAEVRSGGGLSLSGQGPFADILQGPLPSGDSGDPGGPGADQADEPGTLAGLLSGGGISASVGGLVDVEVGAGGIAAGVGNLVDVWVGSGGLSADVGGLVGADIGGDGIGVSVGGLHLGLFGR